MTTYQLWAVYADGREELIDKGLSQDTADFVCNELNLCSTDLPAGSDIPDYRICPDEDPYSELYTEYTSHITG